MSQVQQSYESDQQRMMQLNQHDNGWPTRPSRIGTGNHIGRPIPSQAFVYGVNATHGTHQDHRVTSGISASRSQREFGTETPIADHVQPSTRFMGGAAVSADSSWHPSNIPSYMCTKYAPVTPPTSVGNIGGNSIAGGKSSSGSYARSIAAWDSKVSIDNLLSYGTYVRSSNEPSISSSATADTAGTNELDKLCQQAAELFVGGVGRKSEGEGIWKSLPVNDARERQSLAPLPSIKPVQDSSSEADVPLCDTNTKPRHHIPIPASRKLESSIHATAPSTKSIKHNGRKDDAFKNGAGSGKEAVSIAKKGKGTVGKERSPRPKRRFGMKEAGMQSR